MEEGTDNWAVDNGKLSYALSLVSRMASVFYGIEFEEMVVKMRKQMSSFPLTTEDQAKGLIRSFVTYMANRVHEKRKIDSFILLIDEAVAMEKYIRERFQNSGDVTSCVRSALLDKDIVFEGGAFNTALGISSLTVDPINQIYPGRKVRALVLPSKLNKAAIVMEIWNKGNRSLLSPEHQHRLELVAATVNNNPRLVEIVRDYISANLTVVSGVDDIFWQGLYRTLDARIHSRYGGAIRCPSDGLLRVLIYGYGVDFDKETANCITCSTITNSLHTFSKKQRLDKPETSLATKRYVASTGKTPLAQAILVVVSPQL